jgi:hypothetical protein
MVYFKLKIKTICEDVITIDEEDLSKMGLTPQDIRDAESSEEALGKIHDKLANIMPIACTPVETKSIKIISDEFDEDMLSIGSICQEDKPQKVQMQIYEFFAEHVNERFTLVLQSTNSKLIELLDKMHEHVMRLDRSNCYRYKTHIMLRETYPTVDEYKEYRFAIIKNTINAYYFNSLFVCETIDLSNVPPYVLQNCKLMKEHNPWQGYPSFAALYSYYEALEKHVLTKI